MIPGIARRDAPPWLQRGGATFPPIRELLAHSLYYPASGRDGDPVRYLGGHIHSFVYVDYSLTREDVVASLEDPRHGFRGYRISAVNDICESELVPDGWRPLPPDHSDGDPNRWWELIREPFAVWCVLTRNDDHTDEYGPERFSLLYICGDGAARFQALYHGNRCTPDVLAIIQPGEGILGGNWTHYTDSSRILGRSVLGNPFGRPRFLLYGGRGRNYRPCCWPEYPGLVHYWNAAEGQLGLWSAEQAAAPAAGHGGVSS
jgi:hypothetical protein